MKLKIKYTAQLKKEAGVGEEYREVAEPVYVEHLLADIAKSRGEGVQNILFDEAGKRRESIVLVLNNEQVTTAELTGLRDNDELLIMSPIAGG